MLFLVRNTLLKKGSMTAATKEVKAPTTEKKTVKSSTGKKTEKVA